MSDPVSQFIEAMEAAGIYPSRYSDITPHSGHPPKRFHIKGDKPGDLNGWFTLHLDEPASGSFGSWKTGQIEKWTQNVGRELTTEERDRLKKRIQNERRDREEFIAKQHAEAARKAKAIWEQASLASDDHPYLERKGVKPHGVKLHEGLLVVPVSSGGLVGLQFIADDGTKRFLSGTPKSAAYSLIGPRPEGELVICEGWATGATIHEATGLPVIVAFDAGNLKAVAFAMRERLPEAKITIAADDDRWTEKPVRNPGVTYATQAAGEIKATVARPFFKPHDLEGKPTDFNDLAGFYGTDEVRYQLQNFKPSWETKELVEVKAQIAVNASMLRWNYPHMKLNKDGEEVSPYCTIENVESLLERLDIVAQYDIIKKDNRISIKDRKFLIDTEKNDKMAFILSHATLAGMPIERIPEYVNYIASQSPCNPVQEWVESVPWDGQDRLSHFFNTVQGTQDHDPEQKAFKETLIRKWMISAIAAAYRPEGSSAHGVLVFTGAQNLGKTSWLKSLVPKELKLVLDGHTLDLKDKDSIYTAVSHWLVELGEIDATFRKADIAQLKSFLTKEKDVIRRPYARLESSFARRTVFFGSVNDHDYLHDPTGNRRFWTIECSAVDYAHGFNMQQVWAQVLDLYNQGESWILTRDEVEQLNQHNKQFEVMNPIEEMIRDTYVWDDRTPQSMKFSCAEIAEHLGIHNPQVRDMRAIAKAVKDITGKGVIKSNGRKVFAMPPVKVRSSF